MAIMQTPGGLLGALMMDVDHFKQVDDTHRHLAGDEILRSFKKIPENCLRKTDFIARYGGEEFVVLLPNTDLPILERTAERIRTFVASGIFDNIEKGFGVMVSIGTIHYRHRETVEKVVERADKVLYQDKMDGRNQVVYVA
jgi:diguanylate cyclase (GGDEF)-like protein